MLNDIADIRKDYKLQSLSEHEVDSDPLVQFQLWWKEAVDSQIDEVNAMTLATATKAGIPSARIVLLKGISDTGFQFYTNYESHKAREMEDNPMVCLVFFWKELERQVRIEGTVSKLTDDESKTYFQSRPFKSQIGAWASPQSKIITSRQVIEDSFEKYNNEFTEGNVPRPPHWGGYEVKPKLFEFWQGRRSRLHDRVQYTIKNEGWKIERLAP